MDYINLSEFAFNGLNIIFNDAANFNDIYSGICNEMHLGNKLVVLEKQDNWCLCEDTTYLIKVDNEFDKDDIKKIAKIAIDKNITVFLLVNVSIQYSIGFSSIQEIVNYLLHLKNVKKFMDLSDIELAQTVYLIIDDHIYNDERTNKLTYFALKNRSMKNLNDDFRYLCKYSDSKKFYTKLLGIKFRYYDPNPNAIINKIEHNPTNDCMIRSVVKITSKSYDEVFKGLYEIAMRRHEMANKITVAEEFIYNIDNGFKFYKVRQSQLLSVGEIINSNPNSEMLICIKDHIFYVNNKTIYDNGINDQDSIILSIAKFIITKDEINLTEHMTEMIVDGMI